MNPMALLGGGGGGLSSSSSASGQSGPASGQTGTGVKNINFGGVNPNSIGGLLSNPLLIVGVVVGVYFFTQRKK